MRVSSLSSSLALEIVHLSLSPIVFWDYTRRKQLDDTVEKNMRFRGTCIWTKNEGSEVYQNEEIGCFIVSKDFRMPLRSPIAGTIATILCRVLMMY